MKVVSLASALPVRFGHPGQRVAHALSASLAEIAEVHTLTVDCWNREVPFRGLLRAGDGLYGHACRGARAGSDALLARLRDTPGDTGNVIGAFEAEWSNPRRDARIGDDIAASGADLVVVSEPMLFGLGTRLRAAGHRVAFLDDGLTGWMRTAAARLENSEQSQFCALLAERLERIAPAPGAALRRTWDAAGTGDDAAPLILPVEQEQSDLFYAKAAQILVVATGNDWLDAYQIKLLSGFLDFCRTRDLPDVRIVPIGFNPALVQGFPAAEILPRWTRLHTMIGVSQILFLPCLTPALRPFVQAALSVGTFVVTRSADRELYGLGARPGLYAVPRERIFATLGGLLSPAVADLDPARRVALAAQQWQETATTGPAALAEWLALCAGSKTPPRPRKTPAPALPARRPPVIGPAKVLYTPVTQMMMLQLQVHGWSEIEEVRLLDDAGTELTRLAPTEHQKSQGRFLIEGGIITDLAALGGALRIACFRDVQEVWSARIPVESFETVSCGLSSLQIEKGALTGTLWIDSGRAGSPLSLGLNGTTLPISEGSPQPIPDLGIEAISFRTALPDGLRTELRAVVGSGLLDQIPLPQKPFEDHMIRFDRPRVEAPELAALHGLHSGKRAWIVGNGPSVRLEDLARIPKDDIVFCFNRFYLSYADTPLREDYVVSADTLMVKDFGQEMIDLSTGLPLFCIAPSAVDDLRGDFVWLAPGSSSVPIFSFDPARFVTPGGSSVFVALQMAWYMGIREIALYGMDYSFSARLQRDARYPFPVSFDEGNHFIKAYRSAKPWCPPTWRDISAGFLNARIAFETTGGRIVNATRGGRLETFERVDFDRLCPEGP